MAAAKRKRAGIRIGCSGYDYPHWKGVFYPEDLPKKRWFERYAQTFDCLEVNNTFYTLPKPETFDAWRERTPESFVYAPKLSRYGTHMKRLKDPDQWIGNFVERAERLGDRLGPILAQLPPNWRADPERLDAFLDAAPSRLRWAVEFRDKDWLRDEVYKVLRAHDAALVIHDLLDNHPREITAHWTYLRFHGASASEKYAGDYSPQALSAWAKRIREWGERGIDVYAFFNNDADGAAVRDAQDLLRFVKSM